MKKAEYHDFSLEELRRIEQMELEEAYKRPMIINGMKVPKDYKEVDREFEDKFENQAISDTLSIDLNTMYSRYEKIAGLDCNNTVPVTEQQLKQLQQLKKSDKKSSNHTSQTSNSKKDNNEQPQLKVTLNQVDQTEIDNKDKIIADLQNRVSNLEDTLRKADSILREQDTLIRALETEKMYLQDQIIKLLGES
jgi:hypothetical protein